MQMGGGALPCRMNSSRTEQAVVKKDMAPKSMYLSNVFTYWHAPYDRCTSNILNKRYIATPVISNYYYHNRFSIHELTVQCSI